MTRIFFGLFMLMVLDSNFGFSQKPTLPIDEKTNRPVYTEVVTAEGVSANDLHLRAVNWFKTYFKNPGSVIKENDPATNKINGQHRIYIYNEIDGLKNKAGQVRFRINVICKEGRYKYQVDDIFKLASPKIYIEEYLDESAVNKEAQFGYVRQVDTEINDMMSNLKESMGKPLGAEDEDDW